MSKKSLRSFLILTITCGSLFLQNCASQRPLGLTTNIQKEIEDSEIFKQYFMGFALYDPEKQTMLYEKNADKYFTPASNTKLFTFFACLNILGDSIPALRYKVRGDSLIFWGTGDPSFLHPDLYDNGKVLNFLKNRKEQLFFSDAHFQEKRFGPGWAWDDYNYSFSPERSSFPIFGNIARIQLFHHSSVVSIDPHYFKDSLSISNNTNYLTSTITREENRNRFLIKKATNADIDLEKDVPFKYSKSLLLNYLSDTLNKRISPIPMALDTTSRKVFGIPSDSVYRRMLQESDNFLAEQLLILCASEVNDTINIKEAISFIKENYLSDLPDDPIWIDGSGLSRYNLFTPRTMVKLLQNIYKKIPEKRLFALLPNGGVNGTIKDWYGAEKPYIYAKTGTLSNNHCLSGYLITDSGKRLIFSFMHNNYAFSSSVTKTEMAKLLSKIKAQY